MKKNQAFRVLKTLLILIGILIYIPLIYFGYDRLLMPSKPTWLLTPYTTEQYWKLFITHYVATHKKPNAMEYYLKAYSCASIDWNNIAWHSIDTILNVGWTQEYADVETLVRKNQAALEQIRLGAQLHQCDIPPLTYGKYPTGFIFPLMPFDIRNLGKLIAVNGKYLERQNKPQAALQNYLDGMQFARDVSQNRQSLFTVVYSAEVISLQAHQITKLIATKKLADRDYRYILSEIARIEQAQPSVFESLEVEQRVWYSMINETSKTPLSSAKLSNIPSDKLPPIEYLVESVYFYWTRGHVLRDNLSFYNELLTTATTNPYQKFLKQFDRYYRPNGSIFYLVSPRRINSRLAEYFRLGFTYQKTETALLRLAQIQAAVQLYHLEKKHWPKGLDDLKPYLSSIPLDPFIDKPFLWSQDSSGKPFVYSIGPDFKDDSGKIIYDPTNGTASTGDIVP